MKKNMRIFLLLVVCLGPCLLLAEGFQFGYVDGSMLIGMHPLMRQFNPQTRRFVDTVSQPLPSENPAEFIARLRGRLEEQNKMLAQLDAQLCRQDYRHRNGGPQSLVGFLEAA